MNRPDPSAPSSTSKITQNANAKGEFKLKSKLLWTLLFIAIAVASICTVVLGLKDFSAELFVDYVSGASPTILVAAVVCMLGYIFFEGLALVVICRSFGHRCTLRNGFLYSASDIYFSAITPSATGGQPACAYFMIRDGIPGTLATAALFLNLSMYALSIIAIGAICLIIRPDLLMCFEPFSRALIWFGFAAQIFLCLLFLLLLKNERLLHGICSRTLRVLSRLHLIRNVEAKLGRLERTMLDYRNCVQLLRGHRAMYAKVFLCNLAQRALIVFVTVLTFIAGGGAIDETLDIFSLQSYVVIGTNVLPIPGAMGITDYFLLDAFEDVMTRSQAINLELLSRSLSFYFCVLVCGASVLIKFFIQRKVRKRS